jgi:gamma-glutamylcyclotransferase (GGCT)/AIG2-like uncharacterized protein YtfP
MLLARPYRAALIRHAPDAAFSGFARERVRGLGRGGRKLFWPRSAIADTGPFMPLVFAYGGNMDVAAMALRCPRSKPLGAARLMRHRLAAMREGWLSVVRDARSNVHGILWDVALADVAALDRFEGVHEGLYIKRLQSVVAQTGAKRALIYLGANSGPGILRADYLEGVIAAARNWRLPEEAIAALASFARR